MQAAGWSGSCSQNVCSADTGCGTELFFAAAAGWPRRIRQMSRRSPTMATIQGAIGRGMGDLLITTQTPATRVTTTRVTTTRITTIRITTIRITATAWTPTRNTSITRYRPRRSLDHIHSQSLNNLDHHDHSHNRNHNNLRHRGLSRRVLVRDSLIGTGRFGAGTGLQVSMAKSSVCTSAPFVCTEVAHSLQLDET